MEERVRQLGCERFAGSAKFFTIRWATGSDQRYGPDKANERTEQEIGKQSLNSAQDSLLSCLYVVGVQASTFPSGSSSSVICQTTGPKGFLHIVRSRASSFNWQYPLLSLRSSSSFLRLLPRLVITSICPFIFPSMYNIPVTLLKAYLVSKYC